MAVKKESGAVIKNYKTCDFISGVPNQQASFAPRLYIGTVAKSAKQKLDQIDLARTLAGAVGVCGSGELGFPFVDFGGGAAQSG